MLSPYMTELTRSSALDISEKVSFKLNYLLCLIIHYLTAIVNFILRSEV